MICGVKKKTFFWHRLQEFRHSATGCHCLRKIGDRNAADVKNPPHNLSPSPGLRGGAGGLTPGADEKLPAPENELKREFNEAMCISYLEIGFAVSRHRGIRLIMRNKSGRQTASRWRGFRMDMYAEIERKAREN